MKYSPMTEQEARAIECRKGIPLVSYPKLHELRAKLGRKAKEQKQYRFYSLYDHVCRTDTLWAAWETVRRNNGAPGIDRISIEQIAATPEWEAAWVEAIQKSLKERTYRAQPVRRVYIPKANGKLRPLGIPTLVDRVVQAAVKLIIEPIFEADFKDCSHGFRPKRSAIDAIKSVEQSIREGRSAVYDADLASYFDTIPHDKLIAGVRQRIVDGRVLGLIEQWLNAPVAEPPDEKNGKGPRMRRHKQGTPQGGVLSPLLANIHLHWFDSLATLVSPYGLHFVQSVSLRSADRAFNGKKGPATWANARLVRYADDFVILSRYVGWKIKSWVEDKIEGRLGLEINREKTRVIEDLKADGERLDFLGYSLRYAHDQFGRKGRKYLTVEPSAKAQKAMRDKVRETITPKQNCTPLPKLIVRLNHQITGWGNYFKYGHPRQAFRNLNSYVGMRLTRHLTRRSQRAWKPLGDQSAYEYLNRMGLVKL